MIPDSKKRKNGGKNPFKSPEVNPERRLTDEKGIARTITHTIRGKGTVHSKRTPVSQRKKGEGGTMLVFPPSAWGKGGGEAFLDRESCGMTTTGLGGKMNFFIQGKKKNALL